MCSKEKPIEPVKPIDMADRIIRQYGEKSIYIERQEGDIYMGDFVEEPTSAFKDGSFELYEYAPRINPPILRSEVAQIKDWIERDVISEKNSRLALLYGKAGIGKSVVMHDLLVELQSNPDYQVLGLKSDQVEFVDTDDLGKKLHSCRSNAHCTRDTSEASPCRSCYS